MTFSLVMQKFLALAEVGAAVENTKPTGQLPLILAALAIATATVSLAKSLVEVFAQSRKAKQNTTGSETEVRELREHLDQTKVELSNLGQRYRRLNFWLIFLSIALLGASLTYYF